MANYRKKKALSVQVVELPNTHALITARGLRVADVAAYTSATVCAVRAAIKNKELSALLLGKRHVILREDADAWLNKLRAAA